MRKIILPFVFLFGICFLLTNCQQEKDPETEPTIRLPNNDSDNGQIVLPNNFGAIVYADTLGKRSALGSQ